MCVICLDFQMGKLSKFEARRNLLEFVRTETIDTTHMFEVVDLIEGESDGYEEEDEEEIDVESPGFTN